jgi:CRP-like cAMP-binding protein
VTLLGLRPALVVAGLPLPVLIVSVWPSLRRADARAAGRGRLVTLLHSLTSFRGLDMASLEDAAARLIPVEVPAGTAIITQGEEGDRFYVIESGEAEVLIDGYPIGRLGSGRDFGDRALLRDTTRTSTVRALGSVRMQALERSDFIAAVTQDSGTPGLVSTTDPGNRPHVDVLGRLSVFAGVDRATLETLARRARTEQWPAGVEIVSAGESAGDYYVVLTGHAEAQVPGRPPTQLEPGDGFGEIGLLYDAPRTATVTATDAVTTLTIPGSELLSAVAAPER